MANILIVDDDPAVQITTRLILQRAGHHVSVAGDGRKGLALFETIPFDLLFLDIFMPAMDGLDTMRHIRARSPGVPIVVISGRFSTTEPRSEPDFLSIATKLGAVARLHKLLASEALLAAVDDCLKTGPASLPRQSSAGTGGR